MRAVVLLTLSIIFFRAKAWSPIRNPFELAPPHKKFHTITECMHVTSEDGDFFYKKVPHLISSSMQDGISIVDATSTESSVCGLYIVTDPDKIVEISIKHLDVDCETGGLMGFVDGWELNGQYFPGIKDHPMSLERRVSEFCSEPQRRWPLKTYRRTYVSTQNAALLQYRIPVRGSFVASVRYLENPAPCHIMAEGVAPFYTLQNFGKKSNCTLTALFPAVVSVIGMNVGNSFTEQNYDCDQPNIMDKLEVGGSTGLDSYNQEKSSTICGKSDKIGPEQAIFCGVTTVRLSSSGQHNNHAQIAIRAADENDLSLATLICEM